MSGGIIFLKPTIAATVVTERLANLVAAEVQSSLGFTAEQATAFRFAAVAALNPVVREHVEKCSSKQLDAILKAAYGADAAPAAAAATAAAAAAVEAKPAKKSKESDSSESEEEGEGEEAGKPKKRAVDPERKEFGAALKAVLKEHTADEAWKGKTKERAALFEQWKAAKAKATGKAPAIKLVDKKSPAAPGNLKVVA
jgi:hypothetical protein